MGWKDPQRRLEYQRAWRAKNGRKSLTPEQREAARLKSIEYYAANRETLRGKQKEYQVKNRVRIAEQNKAYRETRKHTRSAKLREKLYGLTEEAFSSMIIEQDFCCPVCERQLDPKGYRTVHVDHDHESGKVRGILCSNCNVGIGHPREDPAIMLRAIAYLNHHA